MCYHFIINVFATFCWLDTDHQKTFSKAVCTYLSTNCHVYVLRARACRAKWYSWMDDEPELIRSDSDSDSDIPVFRYPFFYYLQNKKITKVCCSPMRCNTRANATRRDQSVRPPRRFPNSFSSFFFLSFLSFFEQLKNSSHFTILIESFVNVSFIRVSWMKQANGERASERANERASERTNERTYERTNEWIDEWTMNACLCILLQWRIVFSTLLASFKGYTVNAIEGSYSVTLIRNRYRKDKSFYGMSRLFFQRRSCFWINTQWCFIIDARSSQRVYAHCTQGNPSFRRFCCFHITFFSLFLCIRLKKGSNEREVFKL